MWLINTETLELEEHIDLAARPEYAILSHTWGKEEVSFQEWTAPPDDPRRRHLAAKAGYRKILLTRDQAQRDGYSHFWVDTCCIDKSSSAELSEAINSMFQWYGDAAICYAYLEDVPEKRFSDSRWFTRGWTLQELLAPRRVVFYGGPDSQILGGRDALAPGISTATGILRHELTDREAALAADIATKMRWLSRRTTTRIEDMAYCMLGLFDINMPLLYGEGPKAFTRLQEELIRVSNDLSIFCWTWTAEVPRRWTSILAPSPAAFRTEALPVPDPMIANFQRMITTYSMTNAGLQLRLPVFRTISHTCRFAVVDCTYWPETSLRYSSVDSRLAQVVTLAIPLELSLSGRIYSRSSFPAEPVPITYSPGPGCEFLAVSPRESFRLALKLPPIRTPRPPISKLPPPWLDTPCCTVLPLFEGFDDTSPFLTAPRLHAPLHDTLVHLGFGGKAEAITIDVPIPNHTLASIVLGVYPFREQRDAMLLLARVAPLGASKKTTDDFIKRFTSAPDVTSAADLGWPRIDASEVPDSTKIIEKPTRRVMLRLTDGVSLASYPAIRVLHVMPADDDSSWSPLGFMQSSKVVVPLEVVNHVEASSQHA